MAIIGLQSVVYGVDDLEKCILFHKDFGLELLEENAKGAVFETTDGSTIKIRHRGDPSLPDDALTKPAVRELIWRVDTQASLDTLEKNLSTDRAVRQDADGVLHTVDDYGIALGFEVFKPRPISCEQIPVNTPTEINRWNANSKWYDKVTPQLIHHVGFAVPDVDKLADFYVERLNFRVTDISKGLALFLLADGRQDHHNIFIMYSDRFGGGVHWNHVSYGVQNINELMTGVNIMQRKGYSSRVGAGRHRISSAINYYITNPGGGDSEYLTDTDYIDDSWKPRIWHPTYGAYQWTAELRENYRELPPAECTVVDGKIPKLKDLSPR